VHMLGYRVSPPQMQSQASFAGVGARGVASAMVAARGVLRDQRGHYRVPPGGAPGVGVRRSSAELALTRAPLAAAGELGRPWQLRCAVSAAGSRLASSASPGCPRSSTARSPPWWVIARYVEALSGRWDLVADFRDRTVRLLVSDAESAA
jgi:hypothetical protein